MSQSPLLQRQASPEISKPQLEAAVAKIREAHQALQECSLGSRQVLQAQLDEAKTLLAQAAQKANNILRSIQ